MIEVDKFLPFVVPYADGVPRTVARRAIAKAANIFCTQTLIWKEDIPPIMVCPDPVIELPISDKAHVVKFLQVSYNGYKLESTTRDMLSRIYMDWKTFDGEPRYFYQLGMNEIRLVPVPNKHGILHVTVALAPNPDTDELPDELFTRFWEPIAHGALSDIKQMEGQTFTNVEAALTYRGLFAAGIREAKDEAVKDQGRNAGRVIYRRII